MRRRAVLRAVPPGLAALVLVAPVLGAPVLGAGPAEVEVGIDNFTFGPAEITVAPGTTVTWINRDDIPHTVVGGEGAQALRSAVLDTDDRFSYRFERPGRYGYFCSLHPHMQGQVIVR